MLFSYGLVDAEIDNNEQMYLHCVPFRWPCGHARATPSALPNGEGSGLHQKPLESAIGRVFALFCPGGCHGLYKKMTTKNTTCLLAISMAIAMRRYHTTHIAR
jgi:hypothetical protein